jgi:uncharacterized protein (TIGR04141 family)
MPETSKIPVRILLIKGTPDFDAVIEKPETLQTKTFSSPNAKLYWKLRPDITPRWVTSLFPGDNGLQQSLTSKSVAAVLLVKVDNMIFALTFGYGKTLIKQAFIEPRFGLKIVLNRVDPDSLRSIDTKSLDGFLSHTREQVPSLSPMTSFGIDIEKDFIKAVTGTSQDSEIGVTITGTDSFASSISVTLTGLPDILRRLAVAYNDTTYKSNFEFVDNIAEVPKIISDNLDDRLVDSIKSDTVDNIWLAPPEIIDWEKHGGFCFRKNGHIYDDIGLKDYLTEKVPDLEQLTVSRLKSHKVFHLDADFRYENDKWPVYKCLYAELSDGDTIFILTDGKWFEVNKNYVTRVNDDLASNLDEWEGHAFPDYNTALMAEPNEENLKGEARYNAEAVSDMNCTLMDRKTIVHGGANSKFELCDMYSEDLYIHIKRYTRSSGLSHLFNQGQVSAELVRTDSTFRDKAIAKIIDQGGTTNLTNDRPNMADTRIVFGVVSASSGELKLPFFSKVALKNAVRFLKNTLDVGAVSLVKIQATNDSSE